MVFLRHLVGDDGFDLIFLQSALYFDLAVITHQLARDERLGEAALPALALVLVGLVPVILLSRTLRRR